MKSFIKLVPGGGASLHDGCKLSFFGKFSDKTDTSPSSRIWEHWKKIIIIKSEIRFCRLAISLPVFLSVYLTFSTNVHLFFFLPVSVFLYICLYVYPSVCLSFCPLSVCLSICISGLSASLFVCLSVSLSVDYSKVFLCFCSKFVQNLLKIVAGVINTVNGFNEH